MKGKVKFFNVKKGWGFIEGEDGKDYFVHYSDLQMEGFKKLKEGQEVSFSVKEGDKGLQAVEVKAA